MSVLEILGFAGTGVVAIAYVPQLSTCTKSIAPRASVREPILFGVSPPSCFWSTLS